MNELIEKVIDVNSKDIGEVINSTTIEETNLYKFLDKLEKQDIINICACVYSGRAKEWFNDKINFNEFIQEAERVCNDKYSIIEYLCLKSYKLNSYLSNASI